MTTQRLIQRVKFFPNVRTLGLELEDVEICAAGSDAQSEILRDCEPLEDSGTIQMFPGQEVYTSADVDWLPKAGRILDPMYFRSAQYGRIVKKPVSWIDQDRVRVGGGASVSGAGSGTSGTLGLRSNTQNVSAGTNTILFLDAQGNAAPMTSATYALWCAFYDTGGLWVIDVQPSSQNVNGFTITSPAAGSIKYIAMEATAFAGVLPRYSLADNSPGQTTGSKPLPSKYFYVMNTNPKSVGFWYIPDAAYTVVARYMRCHATTDDLTNAGTVVDPLIPDDYEKCLVLGTVFNLFLGRDGLDKAAGQVKAMFDFEKSRMLLRRGLERTAAIELSELRW